LHVVPSTDDPDLQVEPPRKAAEDDPVVDVGEAALQELLRSRTVIGQAMGLLMRDLGVTGDAAFAHLVRLSSHSNVKLRDVAARMVDEAERGLSPERG
jgi:AmiR/NasT family two-component response regulator